MNEAEKKYIDANVNKIWGSAMRHIKLLRKTPDDHDISQETPMAWSAAAIEFGLNDISSMELHNYVMNIVSHYPKVRKAKKSVLETLRSEYSKLGKAIEEEEKKLFHGIFFRIKVFNGEYCVVFNGDKKTVMTFRDAETAVKLAKKLESLWMNWCANDNSLGKTVIQTPAKSK